MDLFGDLPDPASDGAKLAAVEDVKPTQEQRGAKRKAESTSGDDPADTEPLLELWACVSERRGEREEMQDAHTLIPELELQLPGDTPHGGSRLAYFAVFDGHAGARASRFAADNLHKQLLLTLPRGEVPDLDKEMRRSLTEAFNKTDALFLKHASSQKPVWKDGTTAVCAVIANNTAYVANLGDSKAVLCRCGGDATAPVVAVPLSREHNPVQYAERMRIQRAGGTVRDGRVLGLLEVSRSIGDGQYKRCGVISTPDIRSCRLTANDKFLLLACDGLFKAFTAEEAVCFINKHLEASGVTASRRERWEDACVFVANEAVRRGSADNVTVVLVALGSGAQ